MNTIMFLLVWVGMALVVVVYETLGPMLNIPVTPRGYAMCCAGYVLSFVVDIKNKIKK